MQTDVHASSGIRTHDSSVGGGEDYSCFRTRGHRDRRYISHGRAYLWRATDEYPLEVSCTYQIKFPSMILLTSHLSTSSSSGYQFWREKTFSECPLTESHSTMHTKYTLRVVIEIVISTQRKEVTHWNIGILGRWCPTYTIFSVFLISRWPVRNVTESFHWRDGSHNSADLLAWLR
jgi:hypothetical protein